MVADAFAPRDPRARGARALAARRRARTRRAGACATRSECGLRTPFQRDRDRILHSKPFRRLKGKTQVFIDPAGDHYRTRMTHTLETTAIARGVARALRLNEDLTEAIGLGHDMGHPPFGHAGEEALDALPAGAVRAPLPAQRAVASDRRVAQPDGGGARRHPHAHRRPASRRRSRARSSGSSTASRTSTTTSTTRSGSGSCDPDDLPRDEIEMLGPTGSRRIDTLVHDLVETLGARRRRSSRATRSAPRCSRCARSCSSASTSARTRARSTSARRRSCARIFDHLRRARRRARRSVDYLAGMTDRFALEYAATLRMMARIKDASVEAVKAAADIVALVEARTRLRKVGGRYTGLCPFHEERTPWFSVSPERGTYHCFGCGVGGDAIRSSGDREPRLRRRDRVARRPLQRPARVRGGVARGRRAAGGAASGSTRCSSRRRRSTSATSGSRHAAGGARRTSRRGRSARSVCREFRLGLAPGGATLVAQGAREGYSRGRAGRRRARRRVAAATTSSGRLMFPLADARGRVIGFQARKLREDDPLRGEVRQLARGRALPQVGRPLRAPPRPRRDREAGPRGRRRGEHRRDRAAPGRARAGRRVDGDGADGAAAEGAVAADEARSSSASTPTRPARTATLRGMELALAQGFEVRVVALPQGTDPADDPAGFEARLVAAEPYAVHRVPARARARARPAARVRPRAGRPQRRPGLARAPGGVAARRTTGSG